MVVTCDECGKAINLGNIIKKYRPQILENLYKEKGYELDTISNLSDGEYDVIFVIYKKKVKL